MYPIYRNLCESTGVSSYCITALLHTLHPTRKRVVVESRLSIKTYRLHFLVSSTGNIGIVFLRYFFLIMSIEDGLCFDLQQCLICGGAWRKNSEVRPRVIAATTTLPVQIGHNSQWIREGIRRTYVCVHTTRVHWRPEYSEKRGHDRSILAYYRISKKYRQTTAAGRLGQTHDTTTTAYWTARNFRTIVEHGVHGLRVMNILGTDKFSPEGDVVYRGCYTT